MVGPGITTGTSVEKGPVILLVEDDVDDAFFVDRALNKAGVQHQLVHLRDGAEAIRYLSGEGDYQDRKEHPMPSLILLDLKMPTVSGLEVLSWLQKRPELAKVPVVVLTGSVLEEDQKSAKGLGAVGYEIKPVEFLDLVKLAGNLGKKFLNLEF